MKKYFAPLFFLVCWCVSTAVDGPLGLIPVAGFAAALACVLLVKNKAVLFCAAGAVCIGMCVYDIGFLRFVPALALLAGRRAAMAPLPKKKEKRSGRSDAVYTACLVSLAAAAVPLIGNIRACAQGGFSFSVSRRFWLLPLLAVYFIFLCAAARRQLKRTPLFLLYVCGGVCFTVSSVGYVLDPVGVRMAGVVFPWLLFFAAASVSGDPALQAFADGIKPRLGRFLDAREEA